MWTQLNYNGSFSKIKMVEILIYFLNLKHFNSNTFRFWVCVSGHKSIVSIVTHTYISISSYEISGIVCVTSLKGAPVCDSLSKEPIHPPLHISPQPDDWLAWANANLQGDRRIRKGLVFMSDNWPLIAEQPAE